MRKFSSSDSFPKLRPIVSSKGAFNYDLARFLCNLLSPLVPNDYSCNDTFSFLSKIKNAYFSKKFLVSYDVTTLRVLIFAIFANFGQFREIKYPRNLYRDRIRENLYPRKKF